MSIWSLDLGSSNSAVARWDESNRQPQMIHLPHISRDHDPARKIETKYSIPSSVLLCDPQSWRDRVGAWPFIEKRFCLGRRALIGNAAVQADANNRSTHFVPSFKPYMLRDHFRTLATKGDQNVSAGGVAHLFMRELLAEVKRQTGERPKEMVIGVPVNSFEPYRARLKDICRALGIHKARFLDEPVAAALGYGISAGHNRPIMVVDFGAGTLDLALITLDEKQLAQGGSRVLAKTGAQVGGHQVDSWLLEFFCQEKAFDLEMMTNQAHQWWNRVMIEEARRVKEQLFFAEETTFNMEPPESLHNFDALLRAQGRGISDPLPIRRDQLESLLKERGLYRLLSQKIDQLIQNAAPHGIHENTIGDVLLVGGSTLLPGIYQLLEKRFGRDKVRAWQPFHAVAYGGCVYGSGHFNHHDFVTHDYAIKTFNAKTHKPEYTIVVPHGTPFPTKTDSWRQRLTPTCALGEPEKIFKLVICELGKKHNLEQAFMWDSGGRLHAIDENEEASESLIIPLNEDNPTLGALNPPHPPGDRTPRLEISFGINHDRWLTTNVLDLKTGKHLMRDQAVVRIK